MNTESLAVHYIASQIDSSSKLESFIDHNDRTPFTDGHIDLYSSRKHSKEAFVGRVNVQVKGRTKPTNRMADSKHPVQIVDLKAFLDIGGILYFVVNIDKKTQKKRAYYAPLSPFFIDQLLKQAKAEQKTITVDLKSLPKNVRALEGIVKVAIKTQQQNPKQGFDGALLKDATQISLHWWEPVDWDRPITLDPAIHDFAAFVRTDTGLNVPLPGVLEITPSSYQSRPMEGAVASGNVVFDEPTRRRLDRETALVELSENLRLVFSRSATAGNLRIEFELADNLEERTKDLDFFLALVDTGELRVAGHPVRLDVRGADDPKEVREHHAFLQKLDELFQRLGARTDLVLLPGVNDKRSRQLRSLHRAFFDGIPAGDSRAETGRIYQPVGDWGLELMSLQEGGTTKIVDLFAPGFPRVLAAEVEYEDKQTHRRQVTPYELLSAAQLSRTLNLHLERIVTAYEELPESCARSTDANETVLKLITAADLEPLRKSEFLRAAANLNQWLTDSEGPSPRRTINTLQIAARQRHLTAVERDEVRALRRRAVKGRVPLSLLTELSCSILLEDEESIEEALQLLSTQELESLKNWPIWGLRSLPVVDPELSRPSDPPFNVLIGPSSKYKKVTASAEHPQPSE